MTCKDPPEPPRPEPLLSKAQKKEDTTYLHTSPKDTPCEIRKRTKVLEEQLPDEYHKVTYAARQSRSQSPQWGIAEQDLDTQWIQKLPMQHTNFTRNSGISTKVSRSRRKSKIIHTYNSLEFEYTCEDLQWNRSTSTPYRLEPHGIAERTPNIVKERTSSFFCCNADSMNSGGQNLRNVIAIHGMSKIFYHRGKLRMNCVLKKSSVVRSYPSDQKSNIIRFQRTIRRHAINLASKYSQASARVMLSMRRKLERRLTRSRR